jgi:hypothetical protein
MEDSMWEVEAFAVSTWQHEYTLNLYDYQDDWLVGGCLLDLFIGRCTLKLIHRKLIKHPFRSFLIIHCFAFFIIQTINW